MRTLDRTAVAARVGLVFQDPGLADSSWSGSRTTSRSVSRTAAGRSMPCGPASGGHRRGGSRGPGTSTHAPALGRPAAAPGPRRRPRGRPGLLVLDEPTANLDPAGGDRASSPGSGGCKRRGDDHRAHRARSRPPGRWRTPSSPGRDGRSSMSGRPPTSSLGHARRCQRASGCRRAHASRRPSRHDPAIRDRPSYVPAGPPGCRRDGSGIERGAPVLSDRPRGGGR